MSTVLLSLSADETSEFQPAITEACRTAGIPVSVNTTVEKPGLVDYIVFSPDGPVEDFSKFGNLKAAFSTWAGVERIVNNSTLVAPLCRMVDPGLTEGMVEYVTSHVLRYHTGLDRILAHQDGAWKPEFLAPLARERTVGILGLGALGSACAKSLAALNFQVHGWSRRQANVDGITCHSGADGLTAVLRRAEILVTLLPATRGTDRLIDAAALALLPQGASLINPGRGTLIDDDALLSALDNDHLSHATLDVFTTEPLPPGHRYWSHEKVTVTPHIAACTRPATASRVIAENISRGEAGYPFLHVVDRIAGY